MSEQGLERLARCAGVQIRVIGALIIRELQGRFGRDNIGYLWLLVEPMLLAGGVTVLIYTQHTVIPDGLQPLPFHVVGYIGYMQFRSNLNRGSNIILSNRVLMYHRQVALADIMLASTILELAATSCAMIFLLAAFAYLGLSPMPQRPLLLISGMVLMWWFTTGLAMFICAMGEFSHTVGHLVHPFTYLSLPFSGMFFRIDWLPEYARNIIQWLPVPQIEEVIREGVWGDLQSPYLNMSYLVASCVAFTFLGLMGLRVARQRVEFE